MNNLIASRAIAGSLALAVAMTALPASTAFAQTNNDLQAQIATLLAQIQTLQQQLAIQNGGSTFPSLSLTRDLRMGATGTDVAALQRFLNSDVDTRVAASGAGSPGNETNYFGPATHAAVIKFQNKYRADILTPVGLSTGTGYVGPSTRAKITSLGTAVVNPTTPSTPDTDDEDEDDNTPSTPTRGEEVVIKNFKVRSGDDTSLEEGQDEVSIMDVEFDIEKSDITISRVDVAFTHVDGEEDQPWKTFDSIALMIDGDVVAEKSVRNKSDWSKDTPATGDYRVRFSGLDLDFDEEDDVAFSIAVTVANSVDGAEDGLSWDVFVPTNGIRLIDDTRVTEEIGDTNQTVNIDISEAGTGDELIVRSASDDLEARTIILNSKTTSDWTNVFTFTLDADDSDSDIEIRELPVALTVSQGTVNTFVRDVRLMIDGKTYTNVVTTDGSTNKMVFKFKSNELVIDAGEKVDVKLEVKFRPLASANEGTTISGSVQADNIEAEGRDDLTTSQLSGAANGNEHTLQTVGVNTVKTNTSVKTIGTNDTTGQYVIEFTIAALENDFYIAPFASTTADTANGGVQFTIDGPITFTGSVNAVLDSTARETSNGSFIVREGKTETFTVTVTIDPDTAAQYRVSLNNIRYSTDTNGTTNVKTHSFSPSTNYRTTYTYINS